MGYLARTTNVFGRMSSKTKKLKLVMVRKCSHYAVRFKQET
jgi:hypothetical protein